MKAFIIALDHNKATKSDLLLRSATDSTQLLRDLLSEYSASNISDFRFTEVGCQELLEAANNVCFNSDRQMEAKEYVIKIGELESFREG